MLAGPVNECGVGFIIDSGSTITVLATRIFDKIPANNKPKLNAKIQPVLLADGSPVKTAGSCTVDICFGNVEVQHEVLIADIDPEALLGSDFMSQHQCVLDYGKGVIHLKGESLPYRERLNALSICRVQVSQTQVIPPGKEFILPGKLKRRGNHGNYGMIEPSELFVNKHNVLVGKTLVDSASNLIPVRVMNLTNEPQVIHKDTVVGVYQPVLEVTPDENHIVLENPKATVEVPVHLQDLLDRSSEFLSDKQVSEVKDFLVEFQDVFAVDDNDLGRTNIVTHSIDTGENHPVKQPPRRLPIHQRQEEQRQVDRMLSGDVIEKSFSPWSSPIVLVKKKDGTMRCCIDYRLVNKLTVKDCFPLPRVDDCLDSLYGANWFSTLDLCSGYWQVEVAPEDRPKTAFVTRSGLYQFKTLPFGLCNATATFQRLMELVMSGLQWKVCLIYLDDIIVYGSTFKQELERLKEVFSRLRKANLKLKVKKCELFRKSVNFLGHVVTSEGITADPSKIEAVKSWPEPKNLSEVRSFLGLCSYYRKFIKGFADIARPLHKLTEKGKAFQWSDECSRSFAQLKEHLTSSPILAYPDEKSVFILDTDASDAAIGSVLSQAQDNTERVIAYASRTLSKAERKYCVTRKELLAVVNFVKHFKHYLYGRKFIVRTDHGSLQWLLNFKSPEGQMARWLEILGAYTMDIQHRPGRKHGNADALSRLPCKQCTHCNSDIEPDSETDNEQQICDSEDAVMAAFSDPVLVQRVHSQRKSAQVDKVENSWLEGWTSNYLHEQQMLDTDVAKIIQFKEDNLEKPAWSMVSAEGKRLKCLWAQWDRLHLKQDVLYRRWETPDGLQIKWQLVLPNHMVKEVMPYLHDAPTSAHLGVNRTLASIRSRFYWPQYHTDVKQWVKQCDQCAARKPSKNQRKARLGQYMVGEPMERIAIDIQ